MWILQMRRLSITEFPPPPSSFQLNFLEYGFLLFLSPITFMFFLLSSAHVALTCIFLSLCWWTKHYLPSPPGMGAGGGSRWKSKAPVTNTFPTSHMKKTAQPTPSQNKPVPVPQPDAESCPWCGLRQHKRKQIPQNKGFHVPSTTPAKILLLWNFEMP